MVLGCTLLRISGHSLTTPQFSSVHGTRAQSKQWTLPTGVDWNVKEATKLRKEAGPKGTNTQRIGKLFDMVQAPISPASFWCPLEAQVGLRTLTSLSP